MNSKDILEKRAALLGEAKGLTDKATAEKRDLSPEEKGRIDTILDTEAPALEADAKRAERLEAETAKLGESQGRRTAPNPVGAGQPNATAPTGSVTGGEFRNDDKQSFGWRSVGEFAIAVKRADARGQARSIDPRLENRAAPTNLLTEGVGSDGGYLIPPSFSTEIMQKIMGEEALLPRTDLSQGIAGNSMAMIVDNAAPYAGGGITAYWLGEGQMKPTSKPSLSTNTMKLNKLAALVPVTDELLEDAPAIEGFIRRKAADAITYAINRAILAGSGVGQPLGIEFSTAAVTVAKETGQAPGSVVFANIVKMWAALYAPCRSRAVWISSQAIDGILPTMRFDTTSTTPVPVYLPANGLADAPFGTLFGRPIFYTMATEALGALGDVVLADLSQYRTATKGAGIRTDTSIHLWFDYDVTAFRFEIRVGGQPWWGTPYIPRVGSAVSPFVLLAERA